METILDKFERWLVPGVAALCIIFLPIWLALSHPDLRLPFASIQPPTIDAPTLILWLVYAVLIGVAFDCLKVHRFYFGYGKQKTEMHRSIIEAFDIKIDRDAAGRIYDGVEKSLRGLSKECHDHFIRTNYYYGIEEKLVPLRRRADVANEVMLCCGVLILALTAITMVSAYAGQHSKPILWSIGGVVMLLVHCLLCWREKR